MVKDDPGARERTHTASRTWILGPEIAMQRSCPICRRVNGHEHMFLGPNIPTPPLLSVPLYVFTTLAQKIIRIWENSPHLSPQIEGAQPCCTNGPQYFAIYAAT